MLEIVNIINVRGRCCFCKTNVICEKIKKQNPFNSFINFIIEIDCSISRLVRSQIRLFVHIHGSPTLRSPEFNQRFCSVLIHNENVGQKRNIVLGQMIYYARGFLQSHFCFVFYFRLQSSVYLYYYYYEYVVFSRSVYVVRIVLSSWPTEDYLYGSDVF